MADAETGAPERKAGPGRRAGKYSNGLATRERILELCKRLFWARGYRETTYQEICRGARIHPGTITHHFRGKANIAQAIYGEAMDFLHRRIDELFPLEDDMQRVMLALGAYHKLLFRSPAFRRFTSEYSSDGMHAVPLEEYAQAVSRAYEVTVARVGRKRADFLFMAYKGMDCYLEPYIGERLSDLSFEEVFEYVSSLYYQYLPHDELRGRLDRALASLSGVEVGCEAFKLSVSRAAEAPGPGVPGGRPPDPVAGPSGTGRERASGAGGAVGGRRF
jgi:AcrR family transcriptional regulator